MVAHKISTVKDMLSGALYELALEAFKKGIRAELIPAAVHYKQVDTLELSAKVGEANKYEDVYANDIQSFEKGLKFISEVAGQPKTHIVNTLPDENPFDILGFHDFPEREEEIPDKDSYY